MASERDYVESARWHLHEAEHLAGLARAAGSGGYDRMLTASLANTHALVGNAYTDLALLAQSNRGKKQ